jgi:Tetratricopeptide repeat
MRTRILVQVGIALVVGVLALHAQPTPSSQSLCDTPSARGTAAYNKYCGACYPNCKAAAPTAPATVNPALANSVQSLGYSLGQELGKAIFGDPAAKAAAAAEAQKRERAAQERAHAAQLLNNSGIYLLKQKNYIGAINEFQQALNIAPNDANILHNLASARQQLKDTAVAAKTSSALGGVLGGDPPIQAVPGPDGSPLSLVNLDASVVDLSGTSNASPESLKSQLDGLLTKHDPASTPPDPLVVLPEARDIELLFAPPQSTQSGFTGPQRPASEFKPRNPMDDEEQTKAQVEALFGKPGGLDDVMLQEIQDDALAGISKPAPTKIAPVLPHN